MTNVEILTKLLVHGPLRTAEIREITGWSEGRLRRALAHASRPRGTLVRERRHVYRVMTPQELAQRPRRARSGPTRWSPARRAAFEAKRQRKDGPSNWREGPTQPRELHPRAR